MSGGLAPSKSTAYISNLPFSLTNCDLHKICEKYGKVIKVTVMKNPHTHQSKGVAFVLFLERESAYKCVKAMNNVEMFGRTLKCSIAKDNGRAADYIRRKEYPDKSKCYECGEEGHLSYVCTKNLLGNRDPPKKKEKKRKNQDEEYEEDAEDVEAPDKTEDPKTESLAAAIACEQEKLNIDSAGAISYIDSSEHEPKKKRYKKDAYFSDEEEISD